MYKKKIANKKDGYLVSSSYENDNCPVCVLVRKCEAENSEPTIEQIRVAMEQATREGAILM